MERGGRGCPTTLVRSGNGTLPVSHRPPDRSLVAEQANAIRTNPGTSASKEFGRQHSNCRIAPILAYAKGSRTETPLANFRDSLACIAHPPRLLKLTRMGDCRTATEKQIHTTG